MTGHILPESTNACPISPTTDIQPEMLPCPFCRGEAVSARVDRHGQPTRYRAWCRSCLVRTEDADTRADAITTWNTRLTSTTPTLGQEVTLRESGAPCDKCGKPVEIGQVVLCYDDAGEMHADCERPFALDYTREDGEPDPVVLLGSPMRHVALSRLTFTTPTLGDMVMVPKKPTAQMEQAGAGYIWEDGLNHEARCDAASNVYRAMLAAAPASPIPTSADQQAHPRPAGVFPCAGNSELEPDGRQEDASGQPDRQGGERGQVGGRAALLPSCVQCGERNVRGENCREDVTGIGEGMTVLANLAERIRAAVTYQFMPMQVRQLLSEAAKALSFASPIPTSVNGAGEREVAIVKAAELLLWQYCNAPDAIRHAKEMWEALAVACNQPALSPALDNTAVEGLTDEQYKRLGYKLTAPLSDWFIRNGDRSNPNAFINTDPAYFGMECASFIAGIVRAAETEKA